MTAVYRNHRTGKIEAKTRPGESYEKLTGFTDEEAAKMVDTGEAVNKDATGKDASNKTVKSANLIEKPEPKRKPARRRSRTAAKN